MKDLLDFVLHHMVMHGQNQQKTLQGLKTSFYLIVNIPFHVLNI